MENQLEEKNRKFFKKIANRYDKGLIGKIKSKKISKTVKLANVKKNSKILDIGCGTGSLLYLLSKDKTLESYGIDISKEMLEIAKNKLNNKVRLKLESASNLLNKFNKNYFNYVFIEDAFHHLPDQIKIISDVRILLKENGKLIISDFSFGRIGNLIFHKIEPGNSGMFTLFEYKKLFEKNNFKQIKQGRLDLISVYTEGVK